MAGKDLAMSLAAIQIILLVTILVSFATGLWLLINMRSVAYAFRGLDAIDPGPGPRRASRGTVIAILAAFFLSLAGTLGIWFWAMDGDAPADVHGQPLGAEDGAAAV